MGGKKTATKNQGVKSFSKHQSHDKWSQLLLTSWVDQTQKRVNHEKIGLSVKNWCGHTWGWGTEKTLLGKKMQGTGRRKKCNECHMGAVTTKKRGIKWGRRK